MHLLALVSLLFLSPLSSFVYLSAPPLGIRHARSLLASPLLSTELDDAPSTTSPTPSIPLSPLSDLINKRRTNELSLGGTIETLKNDYPNLLTTPPDFTIYNPHITVVDPSGVSAVSGLPAYRTLITMLRKAATVFFDPTTSYIEHKLDYDWPRNQIRVVFTVTLVRRTKSAEEDRQRRLTLLTGKAAAGNDHATISGISVYHMDGEGTVAQHELTNIKYDDKPLSTSFDFASFSLARTRPGAGSWSGWSTGVNTGRVRKLRATRLQMATTNGFDGKNEARAKFGLKPLSKGEFDEAEAARAALGTDQKRFIAKSAAVSKPNFFKAAFESLKKTLEKRNECETVEDCPKQLECCDFKFARICCKSGLAVSSWTPDMGKNDRRERARGEGGGGRRERRRIDERKASKNERTSARRECVVRNNFLESVCLFPRYVRSQKLTHTFQCLNRFQ